MSEPVAGVAGRVRVIGLGNSLLGDDGVGPALVVRLESMRLPPGVSVVDGGTGGLTLLGLLEGAEAAVLVDAADFQRPPGSVLRLSGHELECPGTGAAVSPHHAGVGAALALGGQLGVLPLLVLYLVQAGALEMGTGLSPAVARALPTLANRVCREAARLVKRGLR